MTMKTYRIYQGKDNYIDVLAEKVAVLVENDIKSVADDISIREFFMSEEKRNVSIRAIAVIYSIGIQTVGELRRLSRRQLLNTRNCGVKTVDYIEQALAVHGIQLRDIRKDPL